MSIEIMNLKLIQYLGHPKLGKTIIFGIFLDGNKVPIDGVLVSRAQLEKSEKKVSRAREVGYYKYLEIPPNIDTISDCGAFDYIQESEPRYEPKDTLDFYHDLKVANGVTIDHIITNKEMEDKEFRYEITLENANKMFELWEEKDYDNSPYWGYPGMEYRYIQESCSSTHGFRLSIYWGWRDCKNEY